MIPTKLLTQITVIKIETHHSPIVRSFDAIILCALCPFNLTFRFASSVCIQWFLLLAIDAIHSNYRISQYMKRKRANDKPLRRYTATTAAAAAAAERRRGREKYIENVPRQSCVHFNFSVRSPILFIQLNFVQSSRCHGVHSHSCKREFAHGSSKQYPHCAHTSVAVSSKSKSNIYQITSNESIALHRWNTHAETTKQPEYECDCD